MEDASSTQFTNEYMRILTEMSNINLSEAQRENMINTILLLLSSQFELVGSYLELSQGNATTTQNKSFLYGINHEVLSTVFSSCQMYESEFLEQNFQLRKHQIIIENLGNLYLLENLDRAQVIELIYESDLIVKLYLITRDNMELQAELMRVIQAICRQLSNTYSTLDYLNQIQSSTKLEREIFDQNHLAMLILQRNYHVFRINDAAKSIFQSDIDLRGENFFKLIFEQNEYDQIHEEIRYIPVGLTYELTNYELKIPGQPGMQTRYNIKIKKLDVEHSFQILVLMEQVNRSSMDAIKSELDDPTKSLLNELNSYGKLYFSSQHDALEYGRKNFFPASFAFTVNEHSGPMVLSSSPDMDHDLVFEGAVKLIAALNTNQIAAQGYINGASPWSYPEGEFRWIAFGIHNPDARGEIEIHILGIVVKENLLMIRSDLNNTLFGLLLGSMNQYMELINNDQANFVTEEFQFDQYFSTLTIVKSILRELRTGSAEVLAAISSQKS